MKTETQTENKAQFTPGPWRVDGSELIPGLSVSGLLRHAVIRDNAERWVALVEIEDNEGEANARLIAAGPSLLEALEKIDSNAAESVEWIRRVAREAIAKATGNAS